MCVYPPDTRRVAAPSSINAVNLSSARTTNRFPSPRCASATKIVRPRESTVVSRKPDDDLGILGIQYVTELGGKRAGRGGLPRPTGQPQLRPRIPRPDLPQQALQNSDDHVRRCDQLLPR